MKKMTILFVLFDLSLLSQFNFAQQFPDSTLKKPTQYRRNVELHTGFQTYEEKYIGKNLNEIKRSLFPLKGTSVWTELNPKVPRVDYLGIHFINKDTGWAAGDLGALIKTTDGGSSWAVIETNTTTPILKVRSFNGQIVIASGFDGLLLYSNDAGETFTQVTSNVTGDLWGLQMINDTLGWACGNSNSLIKTIDGGQSWQIINTPGYTSDYWWIDFMNESYGFIAANGKVLRTTNGGNNWEIVQAGDNQALFSIDLIDSLHIAAAGFGGTSYRGKNIYSSDGGYTWINGGPLTFEAVNCIQYVNADTGYLVMTNVSARKTTNRGQDWITIQGISDNYELQFLENNTGYSAGTGLQLNKAEDDLDLWNRLIINDNFADVFFISEQKGFAISNVLYRTTDGGNGWKVNGPGGSSVIFIDSLTGFIANPGSIWKTTDKGDNWYQTNGSNGASKTFFINQITGWAIRNNIIYKTTDGGENWFTQFTAPLSIFSTSLHFVDSLYGWVSCVNGRPYKTTISGESWIQQTNLDIWQSLDVIFKDHLNGFLLESNKLYRTTNGGTTFNLIPDITGFSIAGRFSIHSDSTIFITGYKTFRSLDGGFSWLEFTELTGIRINGLSLLGMGSGFAVGELGIILKYFDETVPVELVNFTAYIEANKVLLNWSTASETNNLGFFVERIKQGESSWETLTFTNGAGTSTNTNSYNYEDELNQFGKYKYRLKQVDYNGQYEFSRDIEVEYINKLNFYLSPNYPNPFNPITKIDFNIPKKTFIRIILYDVTGREIKKIIDQEMEAGYYSVRLNSEGISSGVYFYTMITGSGYTAVNKLTIIK